MKNLLILIITMTSLSLSAQCVMTTALYSEEVQDFEVTNVRELDVEVTFKVRNKTATLTFDDGTEVTEYSATVVKRVKDDDMIIFAMENSAGDAFIVMMNKKDNGICSVIPEVSMEVIEGDGLTIKAR